MEDRTLGETLRACRDLKVEILLLPEYSVRPETIEWVRDFMVKERITTAVWAGTFRVPPGHTLLANDSALEAWGAYLPVLWRPTPQRAGEPPMEECAEVQVRLGRRKKYPAQALEEVFFPPGQPLAAVAESGLPWGDARDDVLELICAELFLITSPANVHTLTRASMALRRRFTGAMGGAWEDYLREAMVDIGWFAGKTTLSQKAKYGRRPIILVPACTTRAVDYVVTGQAGYLAAGLTTVFCNATGPKLRGQSCFIGTDCWDADHAPQPLTPSYGPYHGVFPGLYRQNTQSRGWLVS